jgi:hypothetical protein
MSSTALRLQPTTVPPGPRRSLRPELRVLDGGRAPARLAQRARYRRRRFAVAVLAAVVLIATFLLVSSAVTRIAGGAPSSAAGGPSPTSPTVVVQPGDTLWSIAAEVAPDTDVRVTVDRLIALNGSSRIEVGQQLELPAP